MCTDWLTNSCAVHLALRDDCVCVCGGGVLTNPFSWFSLALSSGFEGKGRLSVTASLSEILDEVSSAPLTIFGQFRISRNQPLPIRIHLGLKAETQATLVMSRMCCPVKTASAPVYPADH